MIGRLSGMIAEKSAGTVLVDVGGVGYLVSVPLSTYFKIGEVGDSVVLSIHTHVREDAIQLYGFSDGIEKELFNMFNTVTGIGPKLALAILSGMEPPALIQAIAEGSKTKLTKISGLGKKTAERILVELREKVTKLESQTVIEPGRPLVAFNNEDEDVISALVNLGYKPEHAEQALSKIKKAQPDLTGMEILLREALRSLSKA